MFETMAFRFLIAAASSCFAAHCLAHAETQVTGDATVLDSAYRAYTELEASLFQYEAEFNAVYNEVHSSGVILQLPEESSGTLSFSKGPLAYQYSPHIRNSDRFRFAWTPHGSWMLSERRLSMTKAVTVSPELMGAAPSLPGRWMLSVNGLPVNWASFFDRSHLPPQFHSIDITTQADSCHKISFRRAGGGLIVILDTKASGFVKEYYQEGDQKGAVSGIYDWRQDRHGRWLALRGAFYTGDRSTSDQPQFSWEITRFRWPEDIEALDASDHTQTLQQLAAVPGVLVRDSRRGGKRVVVNESSPRAVLQRNLIDAATKLRASSLFSTSADGVNSQ